MARKRRTKPTVVAPRVEVRAAEDGTSADLWIYDVIGEDLFGGVSAKRVAEMLAPMDDAETIRVYINSPGGDASHGAAIYNTLTRHEARVLVYVDGMALSAASIVAMAGDEIHMAHNALMMIHDPWTFMVGGAEELRKSADSLDKVREAMVSTYASRTGMAADEVRDMMADETWMDAEEAVEMGFATQVDEAKRAAALARSHETLVAAFDHPPEALETLLRPGSTQTKTNGGPGGPVAKTQTHEQENSMSEQKNAAAESPDQAAIEKARAEARAETQGKLKRLQDVLGESRPQLVLDAIREDQSEAEAYKLAYQAAQSELVEAREALAEAEEKLTAAASAGAEPVTDAQEDRQEPGSKDASAYEAAVQANIRSGMGRGEAVRAAVRQHPEAHRAWQQSQVRKDR